MSGISQQPDSRKRPGQLKDAVNAFPDFALGLLKRPGGKFISNLTYDVNHITHLLSSAILTLFKDSLTLIGLLTVMFMQKNPAISGIFLVEAPDLFTQRRFCSDVYSLAIIQSLLQQRSTFHKTAMILLLKPWRYVCVGWLIKVFLRNN